MKILLIGGTGILSTDIVKECLKRDYEVYIFNRGHNNSGIDKKVNIIIGNIRNRKDLDLKLSKYKFDVVIDFLSFKEEELKQNLEFFNGNCKQYIFISSATVYRKTKKGEKITENTEVNNDLWDYALDKIRCEKVLANNYQTNKQDYTIVRPYVTYSKKRIPFAIIPRKQWTLANRILNGKPILLWDGGKARCTLTQTKEFAIGIVGLFLNETAYEEIFNITTNDSITWKEALEDIAKALGKEVIIADLPSSFIIKELKEYKGVLLGDKGLDREFDNVKIRSYVPEFNPKIKFEEGIKETIDYYESNPKEQKVDYIWDGRIDRVIEKYYKKMKIRYDKKKLTVKGYTTKLEKKDIIYYYIGRKKILYILYKVIRKVLNR